MLGAIGAGYCSGGSDNWRKADEWWAVIAGKMRALHTPSGYFGRRVWICLIVKELIFLTTTKSSQQYVRKGLR
jgi:hypothetical protein